MSVLEALTDRPAVMEDQTLVISKELAGAADRLYDCLDDVLREARCISPGLRRQIVCRMESYDLALERVP